MPKKGGSGGKHTWYVIKIKFLKELIFNYLLKRGAPGCELNYAAVDQNDPNYDSEDSGNIVLVCMDNETPSRTDSDTGNNPHAASGDNYSLQLEIEDFDRVLKPIILEFYLNGDTGEVIDHLKCYNFRLWVI